eukprot:jgi/Tetstr1/422289/TSEL_013133.t1
MTGAPALPPTVVGSHGSVDNRVITAPLVDPANASTATTGKLRPVVAFVFPIASGHINPSFALARRLAEEHGVAVHYLTANEFEAPIISTGATFHDFRDWQGELWGSEEAKRKNDFMQDVFNRLMTESGITNIPEITGGGPIRVWRFLRYVMAAKAAPGTRRFLQHVGAQAVVYDPIINLDAVVAARSLAIPAVSLLTTAGPGSMLGISANFVEEAELTAKLAPTLKAHVDAVQELNDAYSLEPPLSIVELAPYVEHMSLDVNLVTTTKDLADPCPEWLEEALASYGVSFKYVGPLFDVEGAARAGGHKTPAAGGIDSAPSEDNDDDGRLATSFSEPELLVKVREAKSRGAKVIYASLGTVLTGASEMLGWNAPYSMDGVQTITGKELCQASWKAVFQEFGSDEDQHEWLIVVSLGWQPDALKAIKVPKNAVCMEYIPQVDLLRAGVDLFLTHGGQNSFMESIAYGTPVVVCPGFADQPINGAKAERLGIGRMVPRAAEGCADQYCSAVAEALRSTTASGTYSRLKTRPQGRQCSLARFITLKFPFHTAKLKTDFLVDAEGRYSP